MSYTGQKLTEKELFFLREKYISIFEEFNKNLNAISPHLKVIRESFYHRSEIYFICHSPNNIDSAVLFKKLNVISEALKDFRDTIESE